MTRERVGVSARALLLSAVLASGCAAVHSTQDTVGGWFGQSKSAGPAEGVRPRAYYAASARVKVLASPDAKAAVVGELALHEGVLRYQVESGYAFVTAQKGGTQGWVPERALIERLPSVTPAAKATTPPATAPTVAEPAQELVPEPVEDEPSEPRAPTAPPEKSIFDPY